MIPIPTLKQALLSRGIIREPEPGAEHKVDYIGAAYLLVVPVVVDPTKPDVAKVGASCATSYLFNEIHRRPPTDTYQAPDGLVLLRGPNSALAVAGPWGATVAAGPRADSFLDIRAFAQTELHAHIEMDDDDHPAWAAPVVVAARTLRDQGNQLGGANIIFTTDLPELGGLSSAASLQCAAEIAFREIFELDDVAGQPWPVGRAKPAGSLLAAKKHAVLIDGGVPQLVPFDLEAAGLRILLAVDLSGTPNQQESFLDDDAAVHEAAALLRAGNFEAFGSLMTGSSQSLDMWSSVALEAGALGVCPTGSGSSMLALVPFAAIPSIRTAIRKASSYDGSMAPRFLTTTPHNGARHLAIAG